MDNIKHISTNSNQKYNSSCENADTSLAFARIETYFSNCVPFLRYCHDNGLTYISDLDGLDFDSLANVRGIGSSKTEKIKSQYDNIYKELKNPEGSSHEVIDTPSRFPFQQTHPSNERLNVIVLQHWTHSSKITRTLYDNGYITLGELKGINEKDFSNLLGKPYYDKICKICKIFSAPLNNLIDLLFDTLADEKNIDIYELRASGCSLQDIGDMYDVSRERIRQICNRLEASALPFVELLAKEIEEDTGHAYFSDEQFMETIENERYAAMALYVLTNSEKYEYLDFADLFVDKETYPDAEYKLSDLLEEVVGEGINLFDNLDNIENSLADAGFEFITADHFLNLMIKNNYHFYGDNVIQSRKSYGLLCAEIIADEFPDGFNVSDENLNVLRELTGKKYPGLELPANNHALRTRLASHLILCGKSKYISPKKVFVDENILNEIKQFIDQHTQNSLYFTEIFSEFEGVLTMMTNIDNPQFLHGVLAFYYPDEYIYSRDSLTKRFNQETTSLAERAVNLIFLSGSPLHEKEILKQLPGITKTMLLNASLNDQNLIPWGNNYYNTMNNILFSEEEIKHLEKILLCLMAENNNYCSEELFYQKAKHDMPESLKRNNVQSAQNLFYIAMTLFQNEFEFRRPHIAPYGRFNQLHAKEIAIDLLGNPDNLYASEYFKLANNLLWPPVTSGGIFSDIELEYVRISKDNYVKKEKFILIDDDVEFIKDLLSQTAADDWYIPLQHFFNINVTLPSGLELNEFLTASIVALVDLEWHIVSPRSKDRRVEKGILVRNSLEIFSYDALVVKALVEAGISKLTESQLLTFLQIHQLTRQVIPRELYASEYIFIDQDTFYICTEK